MSCRTMAETSPAFGILSLPPAFANFPARSRELFWPFQQTMSPVCERYNPRSETNGESAIVCLQREIPRQMTRGVVSGGRIESALA